MRAAMRTDKKKNAVFYAILAAALYALNAPLSKVLLKEIPPAMMAALLYLGAGLGLAILGYVQKRTGKEQKEIPLTKQELPYIIAMVVLDISAPVFLMFGLTMTSAANASLLNNFEIAATAVIAYFFYQEKITKRLWIAILMVTISSMLLSVDDQSSFSFSTGSLLVLLACICWGFENNCTRKLSSKNPLQIVIIKGIFSGTGSFLLSQIPKERTIGIVYIFLAFILGFIAYGLSIFFYIHAQRILGAAKTSTYYGISPFIGAGFSMVLFGQRPTLVFILALVIMAAGTYFASDGVSN